MRNRKRKLTPQQVAEFVMREDGECPYLIDTYYVAKRLNLSYSTVRLALLEAVGLGLLQMKWTHQHRHSWLSYFEAPEGGQQNG